MEFTPVEGTSDVGGARLVEQLPMKIAPTTVMSLVEASSLQSASSGSGCSGGNPRSGSSGSDDDGVLSLFLLGASFWSK